MHLPIDSSAENHTTIPACLTPGPEKNKDVKQVLGLIEFEGIFLIFFLQLF